MRLIAARNQEMTLGSLDSNASLEYERPLMQVKFTYDFAMDNVEINREFYWRIMGHVPPPQPQGGNCDQCPVSQVSYFDAILFCNARSRAANLDTVYSYSGRIGEPSGRTYALSGLVAHFNRLGYRLPTEAEWEFAAKGNAPNKYPWGSLPQAEKAGQYAWYAGNAQDSVHPVGLLEPNAFGLYDVGGNVMEWVGDWKGKFIDTKIINYAGSRIGNALEERIVKGGAFGYGMEALRISARSSSYSTLASSVSRDVGFRCALGAIMNPTFTQAGGVAEIMPPIELSVSKWPLDNDEPFEGAPRRPGKLAVVNVSQGRRVLNYVDFSRLPLTVREFSDHDQVHYPTLSPDGKWITWCNAVEGMDIPAQGFIRRLEWPPQPALLLPFASVYMPRWHIDPTQPDTFLVFTSSAITNTSPKWKAGKTWKVRMQGGSPSGEPELISEASYHDGLSADGRYLVTGFQNIILKDLATGTENILFTGPENGKQSDDTSQVCNVSMGPTLSTSGHSLFLDFGYSETSTLVGRPYGLHEILFRADAKGKVIWTMASPKSHAWADAEWSNHGDYAIAGLEAKSGDRNAIAIIDMDRKQARTLVTGGYLADPALWINKQRAIQSPYNLDSLGQYNSPEHSGYQLQFAEKMRVFWRQNEKFEIACLGSSRVLAGIWASDFHGSAVNLGWSAGGFKGASQLIQNYLLPHAPRLKVLVVEIMPGWMQENGSDISWDSEMALTKGYRYDSLNGFWGNGIPRIMDSIQESLVTAISSVTDSLGSIATISEGWGPNPATAFWGKLGWNLTNHHYIKNLSHYRDLMAQCDNQKIQLILVHFPNSPHYANTPWFSAYGPDLPIGRQVLNQAKDICEAYEYCHFYDANNNFAHDYTDAEAENANHLSKSGARKLTSRLDSLIRRLPLRSTP